MYMCINMHMRARSASVYKHLYTCVVKSDAKRKQSQLMGFFTVYINHHVYTCIHACTCMYIIHMHACMHNKHTLPVPPHIYTCILQAQYSTWFFGEDVAYERVLKRLCLLLSQFVEGSTLTGGQEVRL